MPQINKEWLVRTKQRDVMGPFTLRELMAELSKKSFSGDDEIATSGGHWISAQTLLHREVDEVTRTSTRTAQVTQSITGAEEPKTISSESEPNTIAAEAPEPKHEPEIKKKKSNAIPIGAGATTVAVLLVIVVIEFLKAPAPSTAPATKTSPFTTQATTNSSPFVRDVYSMIQAGQTKQALKKLTEYHERGPANSDQEYLIPYAALLITESESPTRAKKFLEQILNSSTSNTLKSQAHHWMGYLMLSEDEGDMGENHFLEALQLQPKDVVARFNLGRAYLKQKRFSQALDYLQLAELETPDLWLIHLFKGRAKNSLEHRDDAQTSFTQAIRSSPERWIAYIYYATFLKLNGQWDEARNILKRMLVQDPAYEHESPAPFGFYFERVDYEQYLNIFTEVMDKYRGEERDLGRLYLTYLLAKQNGNAALVGRQIEQLAGRNSTFARVLVLKVLLERNAPLPELKAVLDKLPPNLNDFGYYAYVLRGEVRLKAGLANEALKDFERALLLEPKSAIAHHLYASVLKHLNRANDAEKEIRSLLGYHPTYIPGIISARDF